MPYISPEIRSKLDYSIEALALAMRNQALDPKNVAGVLNYVCTKLALHLIPEQRYWAIALFSGVFHNIGDEFYRRYAAPYEDQQIVKNGDVYPNTAPLCGSL